MRRIRRFLLIGLLALVNLWTCANLFPASGVLKFDRLSLKEGLSQSIVYCILMDRRGFIWLGTEDGLNRYDGYSFTIFKGDREKEGHLSHGHILSLIQDRSGIIWVGTFHGGLNRLDPSTETFIHYMHEPDNEKSISNNVVGSVYEDRQGNLWVGTNRGLNLFDRKTKTFTHYNNRPNDTTSLSNDLVRVIFEDREGVLWIGTDGGLNKMDRERGTFNCYRHRNNTPGSISNNLIRAIYQDHSGTLWVGTDDGLNVFHRKSGQFSVFRSRHGDDNSISSNVVWAVMEDRSGGLWVGTNGAGLNKFDRESGKFHHFRYSPRELDSLSSDQIMSLYEDRSGVVWVGTYGGGVNKFHRNREKFVHYRKDAENPNSLSHNIVWNFQETDDGILWIGTHGGLDKFDRKNNRFTHFRYDRNNPHSLGSDIVRRIYIDSAGVFWIGTAGGGLNKFNRETGTFTRYLKQTGNPQSLSHNDIRSLCEDHSGAFWVGTFGGGLNRFNRKTETFEHFMNDPDDPTSLSNDYVFGIFEDKESNLWLATYGGGLNKFNRDNGSESTNDANGTYGTNGTFTRFQADPQNPDSLSNDYLFCIIQDTKDRFWIATWGGGLNRFHPDTGKFTHYNSSNGFSTDFIYGILEDDHGCLWLSTIDGITLFDPDRNIIKQYHDIDGLQSNEFNGGALYKNKKGELFFGGINGFNAFFPENIQDNKHIPPIVITSFQKHNEEVKLKKNISEVKKLQLSHEDYFFSFEFAALDYVAPMKNKYKYKMEGLDKEWIKANAKKRYAGYTTLTPGNYTFRVIGSNSDGYWNEKGTSIEIEIIPAFWQTWWFKTLLILVILFLCWLWYRTRMKDLFFRTRMETELKAAHDAQMSIMPQEDPRIKGFDISGICFPANEVGGDFFDYFWLKDNSSHFGIAIGDVSGKAMKAAMTAVMSNGIIFSKASESQKISDIMAQLNSALCVKTDKRVFTALMVISIDMDAKTMNFTNAGLPEPFLKSGNSVVSLKSKGSKFPLGVIKDKQFQEETVSLKPGDIVIFFTDGITEAWNAQDEFYGNKNLRRFIKNHIQTDSSAREIIGLIVGDIRQFSGETIQHDDMTLVVVKVL